jgi:hypothetical protein
VDWYLSRNGQVWGPVDLTQMQQALADGTALPSDLVWASGMESWVAAKDVAALWPAQALQLEQAVPAKPERALSKEVAARQTKPVKVAAKRAPSRSGARQKTANVISRHWRGEFSLAVAHWVFGVFLTASVSTGLYFLADSRILQRFGLQAMGYYTVALIVLILTLSAWQIVGVWRSARRYVQSGKRRNWAGLAKVSVLLGSLQLAVASYAIFAPLSVEPVQASLERSKPEPQTIRLTAGGTEIQIGGELGFGARYELARLFAASSKIKRLLIDHATRVAEPEEIATLVMQHSVATFAKGDCIGACAVVFLAGTTRYVDKSARLGFHSVQASSTGQDQYRNAMLRAAFRSHGLPAWFIEKAMTSPVNKPWHPSHAQLLSAGIIQGVTASEG